MKENTVIKSACCNGIIARSKQSNSPETFAYYCTKCKKKCDINAFVNGKPFISLD